VADLILRDPVEDDRPLTPRTPDHLS
jgi:hypothetical protein